MLSLDVILGAFKCNVSNIVKAKTADSVETVDHFLCFSMSIFMIMLVLPCVSDENDPLRDPIF